MINHIQSSKAHNIISLCFIEYFSLVKTDTIHAKNAKCQKNASAVCPKQQSINNATNARPFRKTKIQNTNQGLNLYRFLFSSTHHSDICTAFLTHACWTKLLFSLRTMVLKSKDSTGCFS